MDNGISLEVQEWLNKFPVLSEKDFYPPSDDRKIKSGVNDIYNGDNFEEYLEYYNDMCDEEEIYDDNNQNF